MSKFHINKHGIPSPCKAIRGNCPYGGPDGSENHFDTLAEAQNAADKVNEREYGILPSSFKENHKGPKSHELDKIISKMNKDKLKRILNDKMKDDELGIDKKEWNQLSDEKAIEYFVENYGFKSATNETVHFFDKNSIYASSLYSKVYSFESGNWSKMNKVPYEETFKEWISENVKNLDDFCDTIFNEGNYENYYNNPKFINKMKEFYGDDSIETENFKTMLSRFIRDLHEEERANIMITLINDK